MIQETSFLHICGSEYKMKKYFNVSIKTVTKCRRLEVLTEWPSL